MVRGLCDISQTFRDSKFLHTWFGTTIVFERKTSSHFDIYQLYCEHLKMWESCCYSLGAKLILASQIPMC